MSTSILRYYFIEKKHKANWEDLSGLDGVVYFLEVPLEYVLIRYDNPEFADLEKLSREIGPIEFSKRRSANPEFRDFVERVSRRKYQVIDPDWRKEEGFRPYTGLHLVINRNDYNLSFKEKSEVSVITNIATINPGIVSINLKVLQQIDKAKNKIDEVLATWESWATEHGVIAEKSESSILGDTIHLKVNLNVGFENFLASLIVMLFTVGTKLKVDELVYA